MTRSSMGRALLVATLALSAATGAVLGARAQDGGGGRSPDPGPEESPGQAPDDGAAEGSDRPDEHPDEGPGEDSSEGAGRTGRSRRRAAPPPAEARAQRHASITEGLDCSACHTTEGWAMQRGGSSGRGFDHARTGFPLTGEHRRATCTDCHGAGVETRRECTSCHEDEHQGRLGRTCDACHSARGWSHTRPVELHRATRLPLTGMHVLADCTQCHLRTGERQWSSPPSECVSCHAEDVARTDVHPDHLGRMGSAPFPRDCAQCHRPSGWSPAIVDPTTLPGTAMLVAPTDHEVRFPIARGSHRGLACESCHASEDVPRAVECVGCHAHDRLRLARTHRGTAMATDGAGCLACHPGGMRR